MSTLPETVSEVEPVPSPALANTQRDRRVRARPTADATSDRIPLEQVMQTAWRRATRRGFAPGQEREYLLEAEFRGARGRDKPADG